MEILSRFGITKSQAEKEYYAARDKERKEEQKRQDEIKKVSARAKAPINQVAKRLIGDVD